MWGMNRLTVSLSRSTEIKYIRHTLHMNCLLVTYKHHHSNTPPQSQALLDMSFNGPQRVSKRCGGGQKRLGASVGNGTVIDRLTEVVVKPTNMRVYNHSVVR
jgi:hypothetical protein